MLLFAIVNANYEFLYMHIDTNEPVSDGGIWSSTGIYKRLKAVRLNILQPTKINNTDYVLPYIFIGDDAVSLMDEEIHDEEIFNYRLCGARRAVENVFGILASRFRIFLQPIAVNM